MSKKFKTFVVITLILAFALAIMVQAGYALPGAKLAFMPMIYDSSAEPTATPLPTHTRTPRPPTPMPTATPTITEAEGGNSCVGILGARKMRSGGTIIGGLVPSVCSYIVEYDWQDDRQLLIVKAERIKTDTWGCMEGDFGPLVEWPPIDFPCPPPPEEEWISEWGQILWGDQDVFVAEDSAQIVCGYCEECPPPHTVNCENVID